MIGRPEVDVAAEDRRAVAGEAHDGAELLLSGLAAGDVEVADERAVLERDAQEGAVRPDALAALVHDRERGRHEDRERLARHRGAEDAVVQVGQEPTDLGATQERFGRDAPTARMPLHSSSRPSAQAGTSCRQTTSGWSAVTSSTISRRYARRSGGRELP